MAEKYICDGEKYKIGGPNTDTITLPIDINHLPPTLTFKGYELLLRSSFHVSLVCIGHIMVRNGVQNANFIDDVISDFCEFTSKTPIEFTKFSKNFWFVSEEDRRSIVVQCEVSNLNNFFDLLNSKYSLNLEYPPTHITLYTLQKDAGIFVTDSGDVRRLTKEISPGLTM